MMRWIGKWTARLAVATSVLLTWDSWREQDRLYARLQRERSAYCKSAHARREAYQQVLSLQRENAKLSHERDELQEQVDAHRDLVRENAKLRHDFVKAQGSMIPAVFTSGWRMTVNPVTDEYEPERVPESE